MQQARFTPSRHNVWTAAKGLVLEWWDNPPATVFWLLLTAGTVALLKVAGF